MTRTAPGARLQRVGAFLSGMIMPNIAAFLARGLITALFASGGWLPNARLTITRPQTPASVGR